MKPESVVQPDQAEVRAEATAEGAPFQAPFQQRTCFWSAGSPEQVKHPRVEERHRREEVVSVVSCSLSLSVPFGSGACIRTFAEVMLRHRLVAECFKVHNGYTRIGTKMCVDILRCLEWRPLVLMPIPLAVSQAFRSPSHSLCRAGMVMSHPGIAPDWTIMPLLELRKASDNSLAKCPTIRSTCH